MQYYKCQKSESLIYNFKMPVISQLSLILENFPSSMWRSIIVYRLLVPVCKEGITVDYVKSFNSEVKDWFHT